MYIYITKTYGGSRDNQYSMYQFYISIVRTFSIAFMYCKCLFVFIFYCFNVSSIYLQCINP